MAVKQTHCYNGDINKLDSKRKFFTESKSTHLMNSHLWFTFVRANHAATSVSFIFVEACRSVSFPFRQLVNEMDRILITLDASEFLQFLSINVGKVC